MRQKFGYQPIRPKPSTATSTAVRSESRTNMESSLAVKTNQQIPVFPQNSATVIDLSLPSVVSGGETASQLLSTIFPPVGGIGSSSPPHSSVNMVTQNMLPSFSNTSTVFHSPMWTSALECDNFDMSSGVFPADVDARESITAREHILSGIESLHTESSGQNVLPDLTVNRGTETTMSHTRDWTNPHVQVRIFSINIESVFYSVSID